FETGKRIAESGVDALFGVKGFAEDLLKGAKSAGLSEIEFYENSRIAGEKLIEKVQAGDLVLIKGARGVRTEKIVEKLLENFELDFVRRKSYQKAARNEHRAGNPRRIVARTPGEKRHADNGRSFNPRFGFYFDDPLGAAR